MLPLSMVERSPRIVPSRGSGTWPCTRAGIVPGLVFPVPTLNATPSSHFGPALERTQIRYHSLSFHVVYGIHCKAASSTLVVCRPTAMHLQRGLVGALLVLCGCSSAFAVNTFTATLNGACPACSCSESTSTRWGPQMFCAETTNHTDLQQTIFTTTPLIDRPGQIRYRVPSFGHVNSMGGTK